MSGGDGVSPPTPPPSPSPSPYPPPTPAPPGRPNLLLLFPDEWRYDWAGFPYPHTSTPSTRIPLRTPVLAGIAANGTRFTQAYVPAPVCAPSRSCLAAAREYDFAHVPSNFAHDYPVEQPTFYGMLRSAGFHVMTTGKDDLSKATQLGSATTPPYEGCADCVAGDGRYHLEALGFSDGLRYSGKEDVVSTADPHEMYGYFLRNHTLVDERGRKVDGWEGHRACMGKRADSPCDKGAYPQQLYEDDWTAANAVQLLRRRPRDKPWMLHVSFPGPHPPFLVTAAQRDAVAGRWWPAPADDARNASTLGGSCAATGEPDSSDARCNYAAEIENLDTLMGQVLAEVEAQGEAARTVVCVTSDHGDMLGDHGDSAKSKPWQGSASVPLVCAGPGIASGRVVTAPVATLDVAATFMELGGATPAPGMTAVSLLPLMRPATAGRDARGAVETAAAGHHRGGAVAQAHAQASAGYRPFVASGLDNWRMVVQTRASPVAGSYKLICCEGRCPNPPSTAPSPLHGYMLMLLHVEDDPFDMSDLSRAPEYRGVVSAMLPLLPSPFAANCTAAFASTPLTTARGVGASS